MKTIPKYNPFLRSLCLRFELLLKYFLEGGGGGGGGGGGKQESQESFILFFSPLSLGCFGTCILPNYSSSRHIQDYLYVAK